MTVTAPEAGWTLFLPKPILKAQSLRFIKEKSYDSLAMPTYKHTPIGTIPQKTKTYQYINTAYPCMNEHQLAIGESTFGGRDELFSDRMFDRLPAIVSAHA
jgi:dipeptidase